jgi:hypothetical protein
MPTHLIRLILCAFVAGWSAVSFAQDKPSSPKPAAPTPPTKQELKIETAQLVTLIKSTIMALQHANQTGNYSVLRDLGSPVFRERYDQARLTTIFSNLRSRGLNLSPVLFLAPNLTKQPEMTEGNELHVVGNFATQPLQIQYEILFLQLDGVWRLNGLAVDAVPVQLSANVPAAGASATPSSGVWAPAQSAAPATTNPQPDKKNQKQVRP